MVNGTSIGEHLPYLYTADEALGFHKQLGIGVNILFLFVIALQFLLRGSAARFVIFFSYMSLIVQLGLTNAKLPQSIIYFKKNMLDLCTMSLDALTWDKLFETTFEQPLIDGIFSEEEYNDRALSFKINHFDELYYNSRFITRSMRTMFFLFLFVILLCMIKMMSLPCSDIQIRPKSLDTFLSFLSRSVFNSKNVMTFLMIFYLPSMICLLGCLSRLGEEQSPGEGY